MSLKQLKSGLLYDNLLVLWVDNYNFTTVVEDSFERLNVHSNMMCILFII